MVGVLLGPPEDLCSRESVRVLLRRFLFLDFHKNFDPYPCRRENLMEEILGDAFFSFVADYS